MSSDMMEDLLGILPEVSPMPINIMDFLLDENINITEKESEINDLTDIDELLCEHLNNEDNLEEETSLKYNKQQQTKEIFYNKSNLIKTEKKLIKENLNTTRNMFEESTYDIFCTTDEDSPLMSICPKDLNIKSEEPSTSSFTTTTGTTTAAPSQSLSDIFEESFDILSNTEGIFASQISSEGIRTQDLCLFKDTDYDDDCNNKDHNYSLVNENVNNICNNISSNDKNFLIHNNDPMVGAGSLQINRLNQNNSDNLIKKNNFDTTYVIDDDSNDSYEENEEEEEEEKIVCNNSNNDDDKSSMELIANHINMLMENQSNNKRKMSDVAEELENIDYKKSRIERFKAIKSLKLNLNNSNQSINNVKQEINTPDICETVLNLEAEQTTSGSNHVDDESITILNAIAGSTSTMYNQLKDFHEDNKTISSIIFDFDHEEQQIDDEKSSIISPPDTPVTIIDNDNQDSRQQLLSPISSSVKFENPSSVQSYISDDYYGTSSLNSVATTINPVQKKSRGRPPKPHSDRPDPKELANLSESEKRYRLQRYKNNNASRQSRLNRKEKNEKHKEEENRLTAMNTRLRYEAEKYERIKSKLEKFLMEVVKPQHP